MLYTPDAVEAKRPHERFVTAYETTAPDLAAWAETALPEGLTVCACAPPMPLST